MIRRFEGKTVVISGAARGQGRSHALNFAAEGANVVLFDICTSLDTVYHPMATPEELEETADLARKHGGGVLSEVADIRVWDQVTTVFDHAVASFGSIDVVVANAGITPRFFRVWETSDAIFRDVIDTNVIGTWHTLKAGAARMLEAGTRGSIVVTGSGASLKGTPNISSYVASKHALVGLVRSSARELAPAGIRVNLVAPGNVNTTMLMSEELFRAYLPDEAEPTAEQFMERAASLIPMRIPYVEPADISQAVMFLASDAARFVTGTVLPVDGGSAIP